MLTIRTLHRTSNSAARQLKLSQMTSMSLRARSSIASQGELSQEEELRAQNYYDSDDAFNFYKEVWGGDNIHVGIYDVPPSDAAVAERGSDIVRNASHRSLETLFSKRTPGKGALVMDMGSAYGGAARYCAKTFGAFVSCVDLSAKENSRNAELTRQEGLDQQIWINGERSFTETGEQENSFDLVTSQDSFLHAGKWRSEAIQEAFRVLKPGGHLVFTDIMQSNDCDESQMAPVLQRIHLDDMGSPHKYQAWAMQAGLVFREFDDRSHLLSTHYDTICKVLLQKQQSGILKGKVSDEFVETMAAGLQSWVNQSKLNNLAWGYMVFEKPA